MKKWKVLEHQRKKNCVRPKRKKASEYPDFKDKTAVECSIISVKCFKDSAQFENININLIRTWNILKTVVWSSILDTLKDLVDRRLTTVFITSSTCKFYAGMRNQNMFSISVFSLMLCKVMLCAKPLFYGKVSVVLVSHQFSCPKFIQWRQSVFMILMHNYLKNNSNLVLL